MYSLDLDKLLTLKSCQREFQLGDSYDCWAKIAVVITGERFVASSGLSSLGYGEMNPKVLVLFKEFVAAVGDANWKKCMEINDRGDHRVALMEAVRLLSAAGVVSIP